jgi:hypothetical protein
MNDLSPIPSKMPKHVFLRRLVRNIFYGFLLILISLGIGMEGYHYFETMPWIDAYVNAAMILSGMGPVASPATVGGKIFAGSYALFSGIVFLVIIAVVFAPIVHRFLHKFHMEEKGN